MGVSFRKTKLFIVVSVFAVVIYFFTIAYVALFETVQMATPDYSIPSKSVSSAQCIMSFASYAAIGKRNLLKVHNQPAVFSAASEQELFAGASAISQRGFTLLGTILGNCSAQHYAIVLLNSKQLLFKVGQSVDGWKILAIKRREVLLEQEGVKERLLIDAMAGANTRGGSVEHVLSRIMLKKKFSNLSEITPSIQLAPRRMGEVSGLYVDYLRPNSFLYTIGLRKNDMLVEVNGQSTFSLRNPMTLMSMLDENMIVLDIVRKGERETLMYRLVK